MKSVRNWTVELAIIASTVNEDNKEIADKIKLILNEEILAN